MSGVEPFEKLRNDHRQGMSIRGWLAADIENQMPRKQRHTAHRVWSRSAEEYGAQVSESTVRASVAQLKGERLMSGS